MSPRIAFVFTHQIQYFTNLLDELHSRGQVDLRCFYANRTQDLLDVGFAKVIQWDNRQEVKFDSVVLPSNGIERSLLRNGTGRLSLIPELETFQPDVVHLNGFSNMIQWQAWMWARLRHRKIVVRGDGDTLPKRNPRTRSRFAAMTTRWFCRHVDHVFYQGEENRKYWIERGARPDRMTWIPCVPDGRVYRQAVYQEPAARDEFRCSAGVAPHDRVFLVSGKLDARKRPQDAIEALKKVADERAKLWFVGSGPLEETLRARVAELGLQKRVHFWGFQNQTQLPRILQAADVCLHPSEFDPWPYSILECALSGEALLLSDQTGSHPDLIGDIGGGLTFRCGDVDDLADKIAILAKDDTRIQSFRENLRRRLDAYSETVFCENFEGVVRELMSDQASD